MATRGQVQLARLRQRPIYEQAQQSMAEFDDTVSIGIDFGRNLLEGYQMGEKLMEKGEMFLDRKAREKFRGETNEKFKDFDEYRGYMGLDPKLKDLYDNPDALRNRPKELEARVPETPDNYTETFLDVINKDVARRNQPQDFSDPNRTDEMLEAEAEKQLSLTYGPIAPVDGFLNPFTVNEPDMTQVNNSIFDILRRPFQGIMDRNIASYRRPNIMLPQGTVVSR
jgi:hypothetical protein